MPAPAPSTIGSSPRSRQFVYNAASTSPLLLLLFLPFLLLVTISILFLSLSVLDRELHDVVCHSVDVAPYLHLQYTDAQVPVEDYDRRL